MRLNNFKVLTFDCYGTLIDWETGIFEGLAPLIAKSAGPKSRDSVLEAHAFHESTQQSVTPGMKYSDLLSVVYRRLSEEWGSPASWEECLVYGRSIANWPAFPDSAESLRRLKERFELVILSNVDNASFAKSNEKLGVIFDAVFTAEDIGSYKPDLGNFEYMFNCLDRKGLKKSDILHVAESMFHDHGPANRLGLKNCWIYRRKGREGFGATARPDKMPSYEFVFDSMGEFADAVESG